MKPGLYVATVRGVEGAHIWCDGSGDSTEFFLLAAEERSRWLDDAEVTDARPLVVLDPESGDDRHRFRAVVYEATGNNVTPRQAAAILDALAATPPAEPMGLGAVVRDGKGVIWLRNEDSTACPWWAKEKGAIESWPYIKSPEVLSEGWSE